MLSPEEHTYIVQKLTQALSMVEARTTLSASLPAECMMSIQYQPLPGAYAMEAIRVCVTDRWNNDPPWLLKLLDLLPDEPETARIRQRISVRPAMADPRLDRVLATGTPFVDRAILRQKMTALGDARAARPILVVNGDAKTGKSYTTEYINHLVLNGLGFDYFRIEFAKGSGLTCGAEELAQDMLSNMGVDIAALPATFFLNTTNNERWPYDLAGKVLVQGGKQGRSYWMVLDGFTGPELREDTRKFINALAVRIVENTTFSKLFRLILLDFDRAQLTVQPQRVDLERIASFGATDVLECVSEIYARLAVQKSPAELSPLVERILKDLPAGSGRMAELNQRLLDLMQALQEVPGGGG